jgi:hypothetical protein
MRTRRVALVLFVCAFSQLARAGEPVTPSQLAMLTVAAEACERIGQKGAFEKKVEQLLKDTPESTVAELRESAHYKAAYAVHTTVIGSLSEDQLRTEVCDPDPKK